MAIKKNQKIIFFLFSLFLVVALTSCGSGDITSRSSEQGSVSHDGTNLNVDFAVPKFLALSSNSLMARATIDNGSPHPLTVNLNTSQISGAITGVPSGNHILEIQYFVSIQDGDVFRDVILCEYSTEVYVWPGQAKIVNIQDTDLDRNIDDDFDYFTNLAEVKVGTNPFLSASVPGESPYIMCGNGITNLVSSPNFNLAIVVGSAFAGTVESANYKIIFSGTSLFLTK